MTISKVVIFVAAVLGFILNGSCAFAQEQAENNDGLFSNRYEFKESMIRKDSDRVQFFWNARIYGEGASMPTQSAETGGFDVNTKATYALFEDLQARVFLRGKYEAGRSQSFFGDLEPSSGILVREAAIKASPIEQIDLKAGILDQDFMDMPMLTDRQSFPAAMIDVHHNWVPEFITGANAQWAIPTSQTLSSRAVDREATPQYTTQVLYANWDNKWTRVEQSVGHYKFEKLPSIVAWESAKYGNDFSNIQSQNNSSFSFDFDGWFTKTVIHQHFTSVVEPFIGFEVIKNRKAPDTYNDGQRIAVGANIYLNNYTLSGEVQHFFIESDAVPAYYNSYGMGHTNREGNMLDLKVSFLKRKFRIRGQYVETKALNYDSFQQDQKYFYIGVETGYDEI